MVGVVAPGGVVVARAFLRGGVAGTSRRDLGRVGCSEASARPPHNPSSPRARAANGGGTVRQSLRSPDPPTDLLDAPFDPRRLDRGAQCMPRVRNPPRWVPAAPNDPLCRFTPPHPSSPPSHPWRRSHAEAQAGRPRLAPPGGLPPEHPAARANRVPARPPPPRQPAVKAPPRGVLGPRYATATPPVPHPRQPPPVTILGVARTYERDHSGSGSAAPDAGALWAAPQGMVGGALDQLSGAVTANVSSTPPSPGVVRAERVRTSSGQRAVRARRCATLP